MCRATLGTANGNYALKITEWIRRSKGRQLHELLQLKRKAEQTGGDMVPVGR